MVYDRTFEYEIEKGGSEACQIVPSRISVTLPETGYMLLEDVFFPEEDDDANDH